MTRRDPSVTVRQMADHAREAIELAHERDRYPAVQWPEIVSMRNRLIHGYDAVDLDIVWRVVQDDLPALIEALENPRPNVEGDE